MSSEDDVRAASRKFYDALSRMANGDSRGMAEVWSHDASVTTMHPIGGRQVGWEAVAGSFAQVASLASGGKVALTDQLIQVVGDLAYELGTEDGNVTLGAFPVAVDHRVTNIYRRHDDTWRMVHHHVDTSPTMLDVLAKLKG